MYHTKTLQQTRQIKEAAFLNQVQVNVQKEKDNHLRWQIHPGEDLLSAEQKRKIFNEQEFVAAEYKAKTDLGGREVDLAEGLPKLSSHRFLRNVGQLPDCTSVFYDYGSRPLEIRHRALRIFQQAVRKVILRCRINNRLVLLRELVSSTKKNRGENTVGEKLPVLELSAKKLLPFELPVFILSDHNDELTLKEVGPLNTDLTPNIPFFNLKVPQHHRLMGYLEVSVYEAGASYVPTALCRTLRTGTEDEVASTMARTALELLMDKELKDSEHLTFSAPRNLQNPPNVHPLRIFNPAPGVYAFKPNPLYLESEPAFHLCPLPRYTVSKSSTVGVSIQKRFLDRKDVIKGIMLWKKFPSIALTSSSSISTMSSNWVPQLSDPCSNYLLPMEASLTLSDLAYQKHFSMPEEILSEVAEGTEISLTPEMVQAVFALSENLSSKPLIEDGTDDRKTCDQSVELSVKSLSNQVLVRMKHLESLRQNIPAPRDYQ